MASRNINDLVPEMRLRAAMVVDCCRDHGVDLLMYCTYRSLEEQAIEYRKTRTAAQIGHKVQELESRGLLYFGAVLKRVGPQAGPLGEHKTSAGPGESWHSYREAFDAVPMRAGKLIWSKGAPEWLVYRDAIKEAGLYWGGSFGDFPHCQLRPEGNALDVLSPAEAKKLLRLAA